MVRRLLIAADALAITIALGVALALQTHAGSAYWLLGLATLPVWLVLFKLYGLYDRDGKRISHTTVDDVPWLFHALLAGGLLLGAYYWVLPAPELTFETLVVFGVLALTLLVGGRLLARAVAVRALRPERVLFVGGGEIPETLARKMRAQPDCRLDPVGFLAPTPVPGTGGSGLPALGGVDELGTVAVERDVDRVVVTTAELSEQALLEVISRCNRLSVKVSILPSMADAIGPSAEVDDVGGVTVLGLNPPTLGRSSRMMKRGMDVAGSAIGLLLTALPMAVIALAIKLDSRGPVLFRQERVGRGGQRFLLLKFRTMMVGAEAMAGDLRRESKDPHWLHLEHDPRITRVGRMLRFSSLDELPQLWNVLRGNMSLVGPRPLVEAEDRLVQGWARSRLDLTPGITGYWQVLGRTSIPFAEMVKLDYLYVTNWSLWRDVRLILRTLPAVLTRRGAN